MTAAQRVCSEATDKLPEWKAGGCRIKGSVCSFEGIKLHRSSRGNEIILDSSVGRARGC